jgi:hypothetical protein
MLCSFGKNTKESVLNQFQLNNLVSRDPNSSGVYYVLKPEEFDRANREASDMVLSEYNINNRFWVREGNIARFNSTFAQLVDIVAGRREQTDVVIADPAYHGGNLMDKSDYLTKNYYGEQPFTGFYFFSDRKRAEERGNRTQAANNQVSVVDFSMYNLLKPTTVGYWNLKSNLKKIVGYLSDGASMLDILTKYKYSISPDSLGSYELYNNLQAVATSVDTGFAKFRDTTSGDFSRTERFETTILKLAGYEGVDVRGLPDAGGYKSPDSNTEGSVIFDLKIGTYTVANEALTSTDLPALTIPSNWKSPC